MYVHVSRENADGVCLCLAVSMADIDVILQHTYTTRQYDTKGL